MPFVQRVVSPVHLSKAKLHDDKARPIIDDQELEAISNHTLCFALKQLASVLRIAGEVFQQLNCELDSVKTRSSSLKGRISKLQDAVDTYDPKNVTVPVGDMTWFSEIRSHWNTSREATGELFTVSSRPPAVEVLYRRAAEVAAAQGKAPSSPTPSLTVTPVLGKTRRRHCRLPQVDIETRKPALLASVRKWTSSEVLGELTSDPDATLRVNPTPDVVDHTLPSPEEQLNAIANKFPSELVVVDVSGKSFDRMSCMRRSLVLRQPPSRKRRTRRQRRNTIATTDPKEIHQAASESTETVVGKSWSDMVEKKSQLEALKEWGLGRLRSLRPLPKTVRSPMEPRSVVTMRLAAGRKLGSTEPHSSSGNWSASSESGHSTTTTHHPRSSISSGSTCLKQRRPITASTSSSVTSESSTVTPENDFETGSMYSCDTEGYYTSFHLDSGLKPLREEEPSAALSSTSILSGSTLVNGESEYELFGRGSTSTTASSAGTVCTALPAPPPRRDSHLSGNRTFPERSRPLRPQTHSLRPADFVRSDHVDNLTRENLCKHNDDRCIISADVHRERPEKCGDSPDSGHNTCSSPVDSVASPSLDVVSECSDLEGVDRVERIREKTTINSSRIPSMCVITPPQSDDETSLKLDTSLDSGEYVTIAQIQQSLPEIIRPTEYVSLNTLPTENSLERRKQGARVTLDSEGKVIYASDSLKRKKSIHTTGTFEPGPCVANNNSPIMPRVANIRPVQIRSPLSVQKNPVQNKIINSDNRQSLLKKETNIQNDIGRNTITLSSTKISNGKQYFPKSAYERESPCSPIKSRPLSPLAKQPIPIKSPVMSPKTLVKAGSPTRSLSPIVSRGAYVRIQQPSDDMSFACETGNTVQQNLHPAVKRSDSYRLANQETVFNPNSLGRRQYGPAVIASPTLLTALHEAQTVQAAPNEDVEKTPTKILQTPIDSPRTPVNVLQTAFDGSRTPTGISKAGFDYPKTPTKVLETNFDGPSSPTSISSLGIATPKAFANTQGQSFKESPAPLTSTPTKNIMSPPLDFTTVPSPIEKSPPKNSRSAMDLFAIIHDSKKKIQLLQKGSQINWPKTIPGKIKSDNKIPPQNYNSLKHPPKSSENKEVNINGIMKHMPKPMSPLADLNTKKYTRHNNSYSSLPRMKIQNYEESPKNLVQRKVYGRSGGSTNSRGGPTSTQDFKRLLLQTGTGSVGFTKESAVDRLKNRQTVNQPIKHNVLSSTILEDCEGDDEINNPVMVSASLVNKQSKAFQARSSPTLETSL